MKKYLYFFVFLILLSCEEVKPANKEIGLEKEFDLKVGQRAIFSNLELEDAYLELEGFDHNGCASCTDGHFAVINLLLSEQNKKAHLKMHNGVTGWLPPSDSKRALDTLGYRIEFLSFSPFDSDRKKSNFSAKLKISQSK